MRIRICIPKVSKFFGSFYEFTIKFPRINKVCAEIVPEQERVNGPNIKALIVHWNLNYDTLSLPECSEEAVA